MSANSPERLAVHVRKIAKYEGITEGQGQVLLTAADTIESLTAQLQEAQATIVEALAASYGPWTYSEQTALNVQKIRETLRRADTSTHDAAILAAKAEGWDRGVIDANLTAQDGKSRDNPYRVTPTGVQR